MNDVKIGDEITVGGVVDFIKDGYVEITTPHHDQVWIKIEDIKTLRPSMNKKDE